MSPNTTPSAPRLRATWAWARRGVGVELLMRGTKCSERIAAVQAVSSRGRKSACYSRAVAGGQARQKASRCRTMTSEWQVAKAYTDIRYHKSGGIARVTINRPAKRNAFRPLTVREMFNAFSDAREDPKIGVVLLTGAGPHTDGKYAFCA